MKKLPPDVERSVADRLERAYAEMRVAFARDYGGDGYQETFKVVGAFHGGLTMGLVLERDGETYLAHTAGGKTKPKYYFAFIEGPMNVREVSEAVLVRAEPDLDETAQAALERDLRVEATAARLRAAKYKGEPKPKSGDKAAASGAVPKGLKADALHVSVPGSPEYEAREATERRRIMEDAEARAPAPRRPGVFTSPGSVRVVAGAETIGGNEMITTITSGRLSKPEGTPITPARKRRRR